MPLRLWSKQPFLGALAVLKAAAIVSLAPNEKPNKSPFPALFRGVYMQKVR
jgi:hypothetical protein